MLHKLTLMLLLLLLLSLLSFLLLLETRGVVQRNDGVRSRRCACPTIASRFDG